MKFINRFLIIVLVWGISSCEVTNLDLQDNPNAVTPEKAEVDFVYNSVVLGFTNVVENLWFFPSTITRMRAMTGGNLYSNAYSPATYNAMWNNTYAGLFPDIDALLLLTEERGLDIHSGSAKIMKAYIMMAFVDVFGDIPYSQGFARD